MPLANAVADLVIAATAKELSLPNVQAAARAMFEHVPHAEPDELNHALHRLAAVIEDAPIPVAGVLAICCGALVEDGGDPLAAFDAVAGRLPEVFAKAEVFVAACEDAAEHQETPPPRRHRDAEDEVEDEDEGEDDDEDEEIDEDHPPDPVEEYGELIGPRMPEEAAAFSALEPFGLGTIAMLSFSKEARRRARQRPELLEGSDRLADYHPRAAFLHDMLLVLDDEPLLVLHPGFRKGYRVRISGVADNFQLHTLLAGALVGRDGKIPGHRPDPRAFAAALDRPVDPEMDYAEGVFNLWNWPALQPDLTLPEGMAGTEWWVWNEGRPADILPFEGLRVVLLGPPPYMRTWNAGRRFPNMPAEIRVEQTLEPDEVEQWLTRLANAPRPAPAEG